VRAVAGADMLRHIQWGHMHVHVHAQATTRMHTHTHTHAHTRSPPRQAASLALHVRLWAHKVSHKLGWVVVLGAGVAKLLKVGQCLHVVEGKGALGQHQASMHNTFAF